MRGGSGLRDMRLCGQQHLCRVARPDAGRFGSDYRLTDVLGLADVVSWRHRCRGRHSVDQLDWQSCGIRKPCTGWMAEDDHAFARFESVPDCGVAARVRLSYPDAASCKACKQVVSPCHSKEVPGHKIWNPYL